MPLQTPPGNLHHRAAAESPPGEDCATGLTDRATRAGCLASPPPNSKCYTWFGGETTGRPTILAPTGLEDSTSWGAKPPPQLAYSRRITDGSLRPGPSRLPSVVSAFHAIVIPASSFPGRPGFPHGSGGRPRAWDRLRHHPCSGARPGCNPPWNATLSGAAPVSPVRPLNLGQPLITPTWWWFAAPLCHPGSSIASDCGDDPGTRGASWPSRLPACITPGGVESLTPNRRSPDGRPQDARLPTHRGRNPGRRVAFTALHDQHSVQAAEIAPFLRRKMM